MTHFSLIQSVPPPNHELIVFVKDWVIRFLLWFFLTVYISLINNFVQFLGHKFGQFDVLKMPCCFPLLKILSLRLRIFTWNCPKNGRCFWDKMEYRYTPGVLGGGESFVYKYTVRTTIGRARLQFTLFAHSPPALLTVRTVRAPAELGTFGIFEFFQ